MDCLVCRAKDHMIGLDVHAIRHVLRMPDMLARAPLAERQIEGLFALRGRGVAVLHLDDALRDDAAPYCVIVERNHDLYGVKVSSIDGVIALPPTEPDGLPATWPPGLRRISAGLLRHGDDLLILLDTVALLQGESS